MDYTNYNYNQQHGPHQRGERGLLGHICRIVTTIVSILSHTLALLVLICFIVLFVIIKEISELDSQSAAEMISNQSLTAQTKELKKTPVLYFDLTGTVCEHPFSDSHLDVFARMLDERITGRVKHSILELEQALEYASDDSEIKEIVFNLDSLQSLSLSSAERLCQALDKLKSKDPNKKITVFSTYYGMTDYILAAHADRIILDPLGGVELRGIGISNLYYKELLERFRVEPYIFRAGAYKSAVEPYQRSSMSPEVKAEFGQIVSSLWKQYNQELLVRKSLSNSPEPVLPDEWTYLDRLRENSGFQAEMDLKRGLVDEVKPLNAVRMEYASQYGTLDEDTLEPNVTAYSDYLKLSTKPQITSSSKIAVVYGLGVISGFEEQPLDFSPGNLLPVFEQICLDPEIKAVVVYLNSPGGEVNASEQLRRGLQEIRDHGKKVVISMHDTAASGAYLIASASDYILATPSTITGSIGVFAVSFGVDGLLNEYGVREDGVANHAFAEAYLGKALPPQLKAIYQTQIEGTYRFFVDTVSKARKLNPKEYQSYAEGRVFLGDEAQKLGLIDEVGNLNDALDKACELSGLKRDETEIVQLLPNEQNSLNLLQRIILQGSLQVLPLPLVKEELAYFSSISKLRTAPGTPPKVMALAPWHTLYSSKP